MPIPVPVPGTDGDPAPVAPGYEAEMASEIVATNKMAAPSMGCTEPMDADPGMGEPVAAKPDGVAKAATASAESDMPAAAPRVTTATRVTAAAIMMRRQCRGAAERSRHQHRRAEGQPDPTAEPSEAGESSRFGHAPVRRGRGTPSVQM